MLAIGMIYALVQISIFVFAAIYLLPLLGSPDASVAQRAGAYANHAPLFNFGNYLMVLPPIFFFLFLGGVYAYFSGLAESVRGILFTALLSGATLIMIWPFGAVISLLGVGIASQGGDPITASTADSITPLSLALSTIPRAVFLFTLSVLLLPDKWFSRTGFVIAALSLAGSLLIAFGGVFLPLSVGSAVLFHIWVFCCSYKMFRSRKQITLAEMPSASISEYAG